MTSAIVCSALLLLTSLFSTPCYGFLLQRHLSVRSCRHRRLRCADSGDTIPLNGDKRSKMNQKMLDRARQLREEAMELEEMNKVPVTVPVTQKGPEDGPDEAPLETAPPVLVMEDNNIFTNSSKSIGEEFVSRFPVERMTLNTPIFTLGAFNSNVTVAVVPNGTYVSVLAERESDKAKQKDQLDKISGEAIRSKRNDSKEGSSDSESSVSDAYLRTLLRDYKTPGMPETMINFTTQFIQAGEVKNLTSELPLPLLNADKGLKRIPKSNGQIGFELMDMNTFADTYSKNWILRWVMKTALRWDTAENGIDDGYFNIAYGSWLLDLEDLNYADFETAMNFVNYITGEAGATDDSVKLFYRMDYLKFKVTGEVPTVLSLKAEIDSLDKGRPQNGFASLTGQMWRENMINILEGNDLPALQDRELIWQTNSTLIAELQVKENEKVETLKNLFDTDRMIFDIFNRSVASDGSDMSEWDEFKKSLEVRKQIGVPSPVNLPALDSIALLSPIDLKRLYAISKEDKESEITGEKKSKVTLTASELKDMSYEDIKENLDILEDDDVVDFLEKFMKANIVAEEIGNTSAERFIIEYFDIKSRTEGMVLSREGAGRFQVEMLKDLFVVSTVKMCQGAVIFDGRYKVKTSAEFAKLLDERYSNSKMSEEVGYLLTMNEKNVDMEGGMQQAALDQMLGRSPCVIVYPKQWNSTTTVNTEESFTKIFKSTISTLATVSSAAFAANCLDLFNPTSDFMTTGVIPDDFLPLSFMPLTIMYTAILVETIVAKFKGFNSTGIVVPSISLFNFGFRSLYTSMPKNRNDIFDTAAIGVSVSLLYSLGALFAGLQITSTAASETVAAYPSVSLALLNSNAVVSQLLSYMIPQADQMSQAAAVATVAAAGAVADPTVHLHWLAIAGAVSFIGSTLQLIPLDNSAGSKIGQAVVGNDPFTIVSAVFTLLKVFIILPMAFSLNTLGIGSKLVFDYFITSQIVGNQRDNILPVDNLTGVSEGRKIVFLGLACLFFFSIVPYEDAIQKLSHSLASVAEYVSIIAKTGAVPVQNNIFPPGA